MTKPAISDAEVVALLATIGMWIKHPQVTERVKDALSAFLAARVPDEIMPEDVRTMHPDGPRFWISGNCPMHGGKNDDR